MEKKHHEMEIQVQNLINPPETLCQATVFQLEREQILSNLHGRQNLHIIVYKTEERKSNKNKKRGRSYVISQKGWLGQGKEGN